MAHSLSNFIDDIWMYHILLNQFLELGDLFERRWLLYRTIVSKPLWTSDSSGLVHQCGRNMEPSRFDHRPCRALSRQRECWWSRGWCPKYRSYCTSNLRYRGRTSSADVKHRRFQRTKSPIKTKVLNWTRLKGKIDTRRNVDESRELEATSEKNLMRLLSGTFLKLAFFETGEE